MFLARWPDGDFNVLTQGSKELHKASNGEVTRTVPHQQRDLRLLHAKDFGDLDLCHAAVLKDGIDLQGELCLEQLLLRIRKACTSTAKPRLTITTKYHRIKIASRSSSRSTNSVQENRLHEIADDSGFTDEHGNDNNGTDGGQLQVATPKKQRHKSFRMGNKWDSKRESWLVRL
jgi:hypothetical protein